MVIDSHCALEFNNFMTTVLKLDLPNGLHLDENAIKMNLAVHLYQTSQCNIGQASEIAGIKKRDFIMNMGQFGGAFLG